MLIAGLSLSALVGCKATEQNTGAVHASALPVLEAYVAAWNRHDSAAFDTLLAADAVHEDLAQGFVGKSPAEVKGMMSELLKMQPDFEWKLTKTIENGSMVAAEWTWTATYTGPGPTGPVKNLRISGRGASVVEIENGKIKHFTDYYDNASYFPKPPADSAKKG
jgi:steroid delta-isomerase-like uncharacterized protein